jgi:Mg-chelatase subunit ChlD
MEKNVGENKDILLRTIKGLRTMGTTALGPAVLSSISMAAEGGPGSTVVVCTDGMANAGLGSNGYSNEKNAAVDEFYERVGEYAMSKGVTVNVVTMEGEDCNMDALGNLALLTGGEVSVVDPTTLTSTFKDGV